VLFNPKSKFEPKKPSSAVFSLLFSLAPQPKRLSPHVSVVDLSIPPMVPSKREAKIQPVSLCLSKLAPLATGMLFSLFISRLFPYVHGF